MQIRYPNHFAFAIMILNVQMMVCQKFGSNKKAAIIAALNETISHDIKTFNECDMQYQISIIVECLF